jgi:hypothetical protein
LIPTKLIDTTFLETASDSWLADFDGDGIEDIALGRLPAGDPTEADVLVAKLARYDQQSPRAETRVVLAADTMFGNYSQMLQNDLPTGVQAIRLDRGTVSDAEIRTQIVSNLNNSPMVTVYTGHGSTIAWSSSGMFRVVDAAGLTNSELGFYLLTTCLNGYTHNVNNESLAEAAIKSVNGGAVAVFASSGTNFADPQTIVSQTAMRMIFSPRDGQMRLGDILRQAKRMTPNQDVRINFALLGDPTIFVK